jgi:hypothetical protein
MFHHFLLCFEAGFCITDLVLLPYIHKYSSITSYHVSLEPNLPVGKPTAVTSSSSGCALPSTKTTYKNKLYQASKINSQLLTERKKKHVLIKNDYNSELQWKPHRICEEMNIIISTV